MSGGIRPGVWIAASAALVAVVALLRLALPGDSDESHRQPTRAASLDGGAAISAAPVGVHPAAALLPSPFQTGSSAARATSKSGSTGPERLVERPMRGSSASTQPDSRAAADLRILEDEAARRAEALGLVGRAALDAATASAQPSSGASGDAAEDARRSVLADAFLVDQTMQEIYQGTLYPYGFPAEERARAFAETLVRQADRSSLLERLLQQQPADRIGPQIAAPDSGYVWENATP